MACPPAGGRQLDVLGPLGHGFQMEQGGRYLLVGGGIGVPPMLGCAQYAPGRCTAILGFRSGDRVMLEEQFRSVCSQVQVATDDGSYGFHGYVDALVRRELEGDRGYDAVLACGPKPMLRNVAKVAEEFGIPCQVSMEERMGCGVGAAWCAPATWPTAPANTCARTAPSLTPRRWTGMPNVDMSVTLAGMTMKTPSVWPRVPTALAGSTASSMISASWAASAPRV